MVSNREPMTPEKFASEMRKLDNREGDIEKQHGQADALMCEVLRSLGYGKGVKFFEEMHKWYA